LRDRCATSKLSDVRTRNKCFVAGAGKYYYSDRRIVAQLFQERGAFFASFDVERVSFIRAIDSDDSDALAFFEQQCLVSLWHQTPVDLYELNLLGGRSFRVV